MPSVLGYLSDWRSLVRRGIDSYRRVAKGIGDAREYNRLRSTGDDDGYTPGFSIEVPLLWGSF